MKKIILSIAASCLALSSFAQITITAADMPVSGDTLRYSIASPVGSGFSAADSGTSKVWDFSSLGTISQSIDTYKSASAVSIAYALLISPSAYGYKVADSFPGLGAFLPVTINKLYTFFSKKSSPSRYVAEGFGANIAGLPTPATYSDEDEWYYFPLSYANTNNSTFAFSFALPTLGTLKISGTRTTRVDGWGTIKTPFLSTATNCIRVRSVVDEIDSVIAGPLRIGIPRKTVEYKFLVNGERYPALWITSNVLGSTETITSVRYRDAKRVGSNILSKTSAVQSIKAYPNPVSKGILNVEMPSHWNNYQISLFDIQGRLVASATNSKTIDLSNLASGQYIIQAVNGSERAYSTIEN